MPGPLPEEGRFPWLTFGDLTPHEYDTLMANLLGEELEPYQRRNDELRRRVGLLHRQVVVTLSEQPTVQAVGVLLGFSDDGDVTLRNAEGRLVRAWPMLDVQPRPRS